MCACHGYGQCPDLTVGQQCGRGCLAEANTKSGLCDECEREAAAEAAAEEEAEKERAWWEARRRDDALRGDYLIDKAKDDKLTGDT